MPFPRRAAIAVLSASLVLVPVAGPAVAATSTATHASVQQAKPSSIRSWAKQQWGTFSTWSRSGTGDDVLTIPKAVKAAVVQVRHDGESNFVVWALDRSNEHEDLLVNEIGVFSGTSALGLEKKGSVRGLEIKADGAWTVTLKPIHEAAALPGTGTGPGVYLLGSHRTARFSHRGESNFIVKQHTGGRYGWNLLVNEIGDYAGTVRLDRGRSVIEIDADGRWTTSPR